MKLTIHRGSHQIGGSIVEVSTATTRLILDVGMPLDNLTDPAPKKRSQQADPLVANVFRERVDGVLLSHAHGPAAGRCAVDSQMGDRTGPAPDRAPRRPPA